MTTKDNPPIPKCRCGCREKESFYVVFGCELDGKPFVEYCCAGSMGYLTECVTEAGYPVEVYTISEYQKKLRQRKR